MPRFHLLHTKTQQHTVTKRKIVVQHAAPIILMPLTFFADAAMERIGWAGCFCEVMANKPNGGRQSIAPGSWSCTKVSEEFARTQPQILYSIALTTHFYIYSKLFHFILHMKSLMTSLQKIT